MKILVFGGNGTIGQPLVELLKQNHQVIVPTREQCNLLNWYDVEEYFEWNKILADLDYIINLAGVKTNISLNNTNPVDIYTETLQMGLNVFKLCQMRKIPKLIQCICSCSYAPKEILTEKEFDNGLPDSSVLPHAYAKRQLYYMAKFYKKQYNLKTMTICFNNVYGFIPNFWNGLKVLDALFCKMLVGKTSNDESIEIWGTGKPKREFIHYKDVASAIEHIINAELYQFGAEPTLFHNFKQIELMNIGSQEDISIEHLAKLIKSIMGFNGKLIFNEDKPDGQMKKLLDNSLFRKYFPDFKFRSLELGINQMMVEYAPDYYHNERTYRLVGE